MGEAYTLAGECERNERGAGADTANTNLSAYGHTSPLSRGCGSVVDEHARIQPGSVGCI